MNEVLASMSIGPMSVFSFFLALVGASIVNVLAYVRVTPFSYVVAATAVAQAMPIAIGIGAGPLVGQLLRSDASVAVKILFPVLMLTVLAGLMAAIRSMTLVDGKLEAKSHTVRDMTFDFLGRKKPFVRKP